MNTGGWLARLNAHLDEDERVARSAARPTLCSEWACSSREVFTGNAAVRKVADVAWSGDIAAHIARHDPARVLREVDAIRRLIAAYETHGRLAADAARRLDAGEGAVHTDWLTACARADMLKDALVVLVKARYPDCPKWVP